MPEAVSIIIGRIMAPTYFHLLKKDGSIPKDQEAHTVYADRLPQ